MRHVKIFRKASKIPELLKTPNEIKAVSISPFSLESFTLPGPIKNQR
jgi:hypothetical protein